MCLIESAMCFELSKSCCIISLSLHLSCMHMDMLHRCSHGHTDGASCVAGPAIKVLFHQVRSRQAYLS